MISHGSVREKYLLSFNRESEKSEKKVRNNTGEIFLMVHPGKEWATPRQKLSVIIKDKRVKVPENRTLKFT